MYTKTGFSLLAAAGVAVGVVGMTMGASGADTSCRPTGSAHSTASNAARSAAARAASDASNASGADGTSGTAGDGVNIPSVPGTGTAGGNPSVPTVPTTPTVPSVPSVPGAGSGHGSHNRPLLDVGEWTNGGNVAGVPLPLPPTGTTVIGRSTNITGLHILAHVDGR